MSAPIVTSALCAGLLAATVISSQSTATPLETDPAVLRIDGEEIHQRAYEDWLLRTYGERRAYAFGELYALRSLFDVQPMESYRDQATHEFQERIDGAFGGDRTKFLEELERFGRTYEGRITERALELQHIALSGSLESLPDFRRQLLVEVLPPLLPEGVTTELKSDLEVLRADWKGSAGLVGIRRDAYAGWLRRAFGEKATGRFVEALRVRQAAAKAEVSATEAEVLLRVDADIESIIEHVHDGDRDAWLKALVKTGRTSVQHRREMILRARTEILLDKLLRSERTVTQEKLVRAWEAAHGPGGVLHEVRWIRIDAELPSHDPERSEEETLRLVEQAVEQTELRANELRVRIEDGEDFATLAEENSDDDNTRTSGGRPPAGFRLRHLAEELRGPVEALAPGELTESLLHAGSTYLFEKTAIRRTPLEKVEAELRRELLGRRPDEVEMARKKNELARGVRIEVLPALFR